MKAIIETERCFLCLPRENDASHLLKFYTENQEHFKPWDPEPPEGFFTLEYWEKRNRDQMVECKEAKSFRLRIYLKSNKELVGLINYTNFERGPFQNCRLGYKLSKSCEGQGLMSEALSASLDHVFQVMNIHRIEANYIPRNHRSRKLLEKLAFLEVGVSKSYLRIDGEWRDHILTYLNNPGWKEDSCSNCQRTKALDKQKDVASNENQAN